MNLNDLLVAGTGEGRRYWMDWIGNTIPKYSSRVPGSVHDFTEADQWLRELSTDIWQRVKERHDLTKLDENIICSSLLTLILGLWSCRVRRAKAYDPRRPVAVRQLMLERLQAFNAALVECMTDESEDAVYFPAQEWEMPTAPNARDGDYV